jgi:hypothetical protein
MPISLNEKNVTQTLLTFASNKPFEKVIEDFEAQLGRLKEEEIAPDDLQGSIKKMEGSSGLMIIRTLGMDHTLPSLASTDARAHQYLIGNPLIASQMTQYNVLAAMYAPPKVLIYTQDTLTKIAYHRPSTVFGTLGGTDIRIIAIDLDRKFEHLVRTSLE